MIRLHKYDVLLETDRFIEWIESMALQGWFIKYITEDSFFVHFKKGEPKHLKYSIYVHRYANFKSDEFIEVAKEQGWELVSKKDPVLFLFKSDLEDPIPLETDSLEIEKKNKMMLSRYFKDLLVYGSLYIFSINLNHTLAFRILYASIILSIFTDYVRRKYINHHDKSKVLKVAKLLKLYNLMLMLAFLSLITINTYRFTESILVTTDHSSSNLIYPKNLPDPITTNRYKLETRASFLSFTPITTSLIQFIDEHGYSRIVYTTQKRTPLFFSQNNLDQYYDSSKIYFATAFNRLTEWKKEDSHITYKNGKQSDEFLTVFLQENSIYTLHTLNFNYEEHMELLGRMGNKE